MCDLCGRHCCDPLAEGGGTMSSGMSSEEWQELAGEPMTDEELQALHYAKVHQQD